MKKYLEVFFKNYDFILLGSTLLLVAMGIAVLFSGTEEYNMSSYAVEQAINAGIGLIGLFIISRIDYRLFRSYSGILYIFVVLMLVAVQVFGFTAKGATRWIDLGFTQFQPSALAMFLMVIILAKYFSENYEEMGDIRTVVKSGVYAGIPAVLVLLQPDLGTAFIIMFIWGAMLLASNAKRIHLLIMGGVGALCLPVIWFFAQDYQKERMATFLNPAADPQGAGWNVNQAMIAIGSGQFWGRGLGHGTQSQLNFIPEKHTDFVFASLAEEMGFLGVSVLLSLFVILFYRGIKVAVLARDFYGTYLSIGMLAMLFIHVFVNIGMNMGIMPVTGIPLPFISYGGTALIVDLAAIGMLLNIYRRYKKIDF